MFLLGCLLWFFSPEISKIRSKATAEKTQEREMKEGRKEKVKNERW